MGRLSKYRFATLRRGLALSVRIKLLALVLAPLVIGVPVLLLIVWVWGTRGYDQLLVNKVSSDLVTARQHFDRVQTGVAQNLETIASSHRLAVTLEDRGDVADYLRQAAQAQGLDYLLLLDPRGRVMAGQSSKDSSSRGRWPVVRSALFGRSHHGLAVFSAQDLEQLTPELRQRAYLDLLPTRNAVPDEREAEDRGLMIQAAVPLLGRNGQILGALEGGVLLNRNLDMVDRINAIVYRRASLPEGSEGTATLFLGDTRIATNVNLFDNTRALGTRVSHAVFEKVLQQGQTWLGSAFVVNDTYVSGYEALSDTEGQRIGMLYVGFREAPLQHALYRALAGLFLMFLVVSVLGTLATLRWARGIVNPLERMNQVMAHIEAGDESARVGTVPRSDELGRLARAFDHLLDSLSARRRELQRWGEQLDKKVAERTAELEAANATLLRAQRQLVLNEKLSAIGELTAGVAHEINNPVAVIQGNLDVLREVLGEQAQPVQPEIRLIDEQTRRIQSIVTRLLQFARPGDFAGYVEATDVNAVVQDCLVLTRHNLNKAAVLVDTQLSATCTVEMNRGELQQVLINLIVNALHAMPDGGTLLLSSQDVNDEQPGEACACRGVSVTVQDTGCGIAPDDLDRIFNPFFTTKRHNGTGLGLSISYAIIQRYGGQIDVDSRPGHGSRFTVLLRTQAHYSDPTHSSLENFFLTTPGLDKPT